MIAAIIVVDSVKCDECTGNCPRVTAVGTEVFGGPFGMKVVVSEFIDEAALAGFGGLAEVVYGPKLVDDRAALVAACSDAEALIVRNRTQVDRAVLDLSLIHI